MGRISFNSTSGLYCTLFSILNVHVPFLTVTFCIRGDVPQHSFCLLSRTAPPNNLCLTVTFFIRNAVPLSGFPLSGFPLSGFPLSTSLKHMITVTLFVRWAFCFLLLVRLFLLSNLFITVTGFIRETLLLPGLLDPLSYFKIILIIRWTPLFQCSSAWFL